MAVGIPERITDDLGIGACVVDQHHRLAIFSAGKTVVTRAVNAVLVTGLKYWLSFDQNFLKGLVSYPTKTTNRGT